MKDPPTRRLRDWDYTINIDTSRIGDTDPVYHPNPGGTSMSGSVQMQFDPKSFSNAFGIVGSTMRSLAESFGHALGEAITGGITIMTTTLGMHDIANRGKIDAKGSDSYTITTWQGQFWAEVSDGDSTIKLGTKDFTFRLVGHNPTVGLIRSVAPIWFGRHDQPPILEAHDDDGVTERHWEFGTASVWVDWIGASIEVNQYLKVQRTDTEELYPHDFGFSSCECPTCAAERPKQEFLRKLDDAIELVRRSGEYREVIPDTLIVNEGWVTVYSGGSQLYPITVARYQHIDGTATGSVEALYQDPDATVLTARKSGRREEIQITDAVTLKDVAERIDQYLSETGMIRHEVEKRPGVVLWMPSRLRLYKVTDAEGRAHNGGSYQYDLPEPTTTLFEEDTPGAWSDPIETEELSICSTGYHLTTNPFPWMRPDSRVFVAEANDLLPEHSGDKFVAGSIRLTREVNLDSIMPTWAAMKRHMNDVVMPAIDAFARVMQGEVEHGELPEWATVDQGEFVKSLNQILVVGNPYADESGRRMYTEESRDYRKMAERFRTFILEELNCNCAIVDRWTNTTAVCDVTMEAYRAIAAGAPTAREWIDPLWTDIVARGYLPLGADHHFGGKVYVKKAETVLTPSDDDSDGPF